jgi:hypothetical protein
MKAAIAAVFGLALAGVLAAPAVAQAHEKPGYRTHKGKKHLRYVRPRHDGSAGRSDYYEHLADKLPVGSSRWFEQMEREGRFGHREH